MTQSRSVLLDPEYKAVRMRLEEVARRWATGRTARDCGACPTGPRRPT